MKIAYISQSYPPMVSGASFVVQRLAEGMAQRGHSVLVIVASNREDAYIENLDNLKILRLKSIPNPKRACQRYMRWPFKSILSELEVFNPDVIHIHDVLMLGIVGLSVGRFLNIPVVATIHQLPWFVSAYLPDIPGLQQLVESNLWKYSGWLNKQCETMIVPTETVSQVVDSCGGFRTTIISNGVDLQHFCPILTNPKDADGLLRKYGLDPRLPVILHVGRLDIDKKVSAVIKAAALAMRRTSAQLLVVGDGECQTSLVNLSKKLGIAHRCHFPGFVDAASDLPVLYRCATVFITASEIETQGLVLLEAMASGLPIVAVDATCIHEVVKTGRNGYLVPLGDICGLSEGLIDILRNPIQAGKMGELSRSIVESQSICDSINQHETVYHRIVNQYQRSKKRNSLPKRILFSEDKGNRLE